MTYYHPDSNSSDDETMSYSPLKHTRVVSNGSDFFQGPTRPNSPQYFFNISYDPDMDAISASPATTVPTPTLPLRYPATTTLPTALTVVAANPSSAAPPPPTLTTGTNGPQQDMSHDAARATIRAYILASGWFQAGQMEPCADGTGVPGCALLLANAGESIWACFFKRTRRNGATVFKCVSCDHKTDRLNRAVEHQRAKGQHKPFACTDQGCAFRGSTLGSLTDHRSARTGTTRCEFCGKDIMIKNLARHRLQHFH